MNSRQKQQNAVFNLSSNSESAPEIEDVSASNKLVSLIIATPTDRCQQQRKQGTRYKSFLDQRVKGKNAAAVKQSRLTVGRAQTKPNRLNLTRSARTTLGLIPQRRLLLFAASARGRALYLCV